MLRWLAFPCIAGALYGLHGCGAFGCSDVGCEDDDTFEVTIIGKEIPFQSDDPSVGGPSDFVDLPNGTYVVTVATDKETVTADCVVGSADECYVSGMSVAIWLDAMAYDWGNASVIEVAFDAVPRRVTVTISLDGSEVTSKTYEPHAHEFQPNGPGCEPTCHAVADPVISTLP